MERKEYWGKGKNEKEPPEERTERICQLVETRTEASRKNFVNQGRTHNTRGYSGRQSYIIHTITTPLYYAVKEGNLKIVQTLLKNGARIDDQKEGIRSVRDLIKSWQLAPTGENPSAQQQIRDLVELQSYIETRAIESDFTGLKNAFNELYLFFKPEHLPDAITKSVGFVEEQGFDTDVKETKLKLAKELRDAACDRENPKQALATWLDKLDQAENKDKYLKFLNDGRLEGFF